MYKYQRIRDLREDKDYTQAEVAKMLKVGTTTYRRWETGEREIPTHKLIELSKIYGVTVDYLLNLNNTAINNQSIKIEQNGNKNKINNIKIN